jgi:hypothetical protein
MDDSNKGNEGNEGNEGNKGNPISPLIKYGGSCEDRAAFVSELQEKIPELKSRLGPQVRCYFYINIQIDKWYVTFNIFIPPEKTYKLCIYPSADYIALNQVPKEIVDAFGTWLETLDVVKTRQMGRACDIKEELMMKTCLPPKSITDLLSEQDL